MTASGRMLAVTKLLAATLLVLGLVTGDCGEDALTFVASDDYIECKHDSGFSFDGSQTINATAFCGSVVCRQLAIKLQLTSGGDCLNVEGMRDILTASTVDIGDTSLMLDCSAVPNADQDLQLRRLPVGTFGTCTPEMRDRTEFPYHYLWCQEDSGFTFTSTGDDAPVVDMVAFCKSKNCAQMVFDLNFAKGSTCLQESNLKTTTTIDGTVVDCARVKDAQEFYPPLPTGTFGQCTPEMRATLSVRSYYLCQNVTGFSFSDLLNPDAQKVNKASFCQSFCRAMVDELLSQDGMACVDVAGFKDILTYTDDDELVLDCDSSGASPLLPPLGTVGECTPAMRQYVDLRAFRGCQDNSKYAFGSSSLTTFSPSFCSSLNCVKVVDGLERGNGSACLHADGMSDILKQDPVTNATRIDCNVLSTLDFTVIPTGLFGDSCTDERRSKVNVDHYRGCHKTSGFSFDGSEETFPERFCSDNDCMHLYDALVVGGGLSCLTVPGLLHNGTLKINDLMAANAGSAWCSFVALEPDDPFSKKQDETTLGSQASDGSLSGAEGSQLSTVALVGILVAGVVLFVIMVVLVVLWCRRQRRRQAPDDKTYQLTTGTAGSSGTVSSTLSLVDDTTIQAVRIPYEKLEFCDLIGSGAYGMVFRGTYRAHPVAIKTLLQEARHDSTQIELLLTEVKTMAAMDHPRIVMFIGVAWDALTELCVVSELMPRGDLCSVLRQFDDQRSELARPRGFDDDKIRMAFHVVHALAYLHSLQPVVLHRDLKSRNVLVDDQLNAKVTDFGVSRLVEDNTMTEGVGSALWMAPEVMAGGHYDEKADVFSFGIVLSELDTHASPYSNVGDATGDSRHPLSVPVILQMVAQGQLRVAFTQQPEQCAMTQLALDCVAVERADRPSTLEVLSRVKKIQRDGGQKQIGGLL